MDQSLAQLLADVFAVPAKEIKPELQKSAVGTWDSLKQMDLVLALEQRYGTLLEIEDIVRMTSVADIVSVLHEKGVSLEH